MRQTSVFSTLMVFAVLTLAGYGLVPLLSVQLLPTAQAPSLTVRYGWPDASPDAIEREVSTPLEGAFGLVEGVEHISSVSGNGDGSIRLDLDKYTNRDYLRFEVAAKIRQLYPRLPQGVSYPQIFVNTPDLKAEDRPILTWSLSGHSTPSDLYRYAAETLTPQLALTAGIRNIEVTGGNREEWVVTYDAAQLRTLGFGKAGILRAFHEAFGSEALGTAREGNHVLYVSLSQAPDVAAQEGGTVLKEVVIGRAGTRIIRLGDVAEVRLQEQKPRGHYRINGQNSVRLLMYAESGVNTLHLADEVKGQVANLAGNLPASYRLYLEDDTTGFLSIELEKIKQRTLWSLGILLLFVAIVYRNWRYAGVVLCSLLSNLGLAAIFYYALGVELHLYALAGITVSFGIIIDNTIVMMHHLQKHGNRRVFPALLASTLTTMAALVIIWFLPEQWQVNLTEFARVLAINLGVSLAVALWLIPALMVQFGIAKAAATAKVPKRKIRHFALSIHRFYKKILLLTLRFRKTAVLLAVLLFGTPVFLLPGKIDGWDFYNKTLGNDWYTENVKPVVNKVLGGTLRLFSWYVWEGGSFRQPEETALYVQGKMPPGATMEQLNEVFEKIDAYLSQYPAEIKKYVTTVQSGEYASTQIIFNKGYDQAFPHHLKSRLIAFSLGLGGVKWSIYGIGQGFSNESGSGPPTFRVKMLGYNKDELLRQAERFAGKLLAHPRIQEVNTEANLDWWEKDRYAYELRLNGRSLAERRIPPWRLREVFDDFNRMETPGFYLPGAQPVRLVSSELVQNDLWKLQHIAQNVDSLKVFFPEIGSFEKIKVASSIHKEDQQYIRMVEFQYNGSSRFGSRYLDQNMEEMRREMPLGYSLDRARWNWRQSTRRQYGLLGLVIGLIFFICAVTFESLRQALAIVLMIPLSFIGIFLTFYWFDFPFDQGGYTSFLMVSGLTVNSLILIVNDFNGFRKKARHRASLDLYLKVFYHKITPILLSIISTALGLLPFTMYGQQEAFWFSLAVGTIGGLLFSLLVITFMIPVFFVKKEKPASADHLA
jgi:multidrug efflux pump subunit AcrB